MKILQVIPILSVTVNLQLIFCLVSFISCLGIDSFSEFTSQSYASNTPNMSGAVILDSDLNVELVSRGLKSPTSMVFLGPNDILVLEKNEGTVRMVMNGTLLPEPLLKVPVSSVGERGMLGIVMAKQENRTTTYVFVYFTTEGLSVNNPVSNRLYSYELAKR